MRERFSPEGLLARTGGMYILVAVVLVQLLGIPAVALGAVLIGLNGDFTPEQLDALSSIAFITILTATLILLWSTWLLTPVSRKKLEAWQNKDIRTKPEDELTAWREISAFSWRYGIAAIVVGFVVAVLPAAVYLYNSGIASRDQYIYILFAGLVSVLLISIFGATVIEQLLKPARLILLPKDPAWQIAGRSGLLVARKFQAAVLVMAAVGILIVAPIGYHHIVRSSITQSADVVLDFQVEALVFSFFVLGLGLALAYYATRPVSDFLLEMINTFLKVEQGDLTQRASITATDETAELAIHFNSMIARLEGLQEKLEEEIKHRAEQLEATYEVGQAAHTIQNSDQMIEKVTNLIGERFGYYFVALYVIDPAERWADLKGATGAAGQVLLANKHRIDLGERNVITLTISSRQMQVSAQTAESQAHNLLLPYTRSEVAFPLLIGDRIYGVLDVHSTQETAFGPQEIKMLQNMANQVVAALENARLYEEAQQSIQEMKAGQRSYLKTSWDTLSGERPGLGYTVGDEETDGEPEIAVPLTLRDQKIGEINLSGGVDWSADERSIVEAIATQAALALENARLVEESQASAARDHLLADITSKIWSATTIDGILQTAIRELGRALETDEATIELKVE